MIRQRLLLTVLVISFAIFASATVFGQSKDMGIVGRMVSVERVNEDDCDDLSDDGRCAFVAIEKAHKKLPLFMEHFRCVSASGKPNVQLASHYAPFSRHDRGPVVMVEARDLRCSIDPRTEFILVSDKDLPFECSRLAWKCNVIWIPDYDQTEAFIGQLF